MDRKTEKIIEKAFGKSIEEIRSTPISELPRNKPRPSALARTHEEIDREFCKALGIKEK